MERSPAWEDLRSRMGTCTPRWGPEPGFIRLNCRRHAGSSGRSPCQSRAPGSRSTTSFNVVGTRVGTVQQQVQERRTSPAGSATFRPRRRQARRYRRAHHSGSESLSCYSTRTLHDFTSGDRGRLLASVTVIIDGSADRRRRKSEFLKGSTLLRPSMACTPGKSLLVEKPEGSANHCLQRKSDWKPTCSLMFGCTLW